MPYYEYHCRGNGRTVEVRHGMSEAVQTWGELCERAGMDVDTTPVDAPVERLISVPVPAPGGSKEAGFQGCGVGCACALDA